MQGEAWGEEAVFTAPARAHVGLLAFLCLLPTLST